MVNDVVNVNVDVDADMDSYLESQWPRTVGFLQ